MFSGGRLGSPFTKYLGRGGHVKPFFTLYIFIVMNTDKMAFWFSGNSFAPVVRWASSQIIKSNAGMSVGFLGFG